MAITAVGSADLGNATGFVFTANYTCGSGTNRRFWLGFIGDFSAGDGGGGFDDIANVGYGGVAMTLAVKNIINVHQAPRYSYLYFLDNPASGTNQVAIVTSNSHFIAATGADFAGVAQTGSVDATAINDSGGVASSLTTSITTVADNCWTVLVESGYSGNAAPTSGTGANFLAVQATFGTPAIYDSDADITPPGAYSMTTNRSGSVEYISHAIASMAPFIDIRPAMQM